MKKNKFGKKRIVSSKLIIISLVLSLLILLSSLVLATPNSINIQGKLTNPSNNILTGTFNFTFRIYDDYTSGNKLFEKANLTSATDPRGVYDIIIKDINISFDKQLYLGIELNSDGEMSPRINLTSVPYSFRANTSDELDVNRSYTVLGLNVTENITVGDKITFRLRESIDNLVDGFLRISGSANITESLIILGGVNVSGDLNVLGKVGIGTTSPTEKLSVIGNLSLDFGASMNNEYGQSIFFTVDSTPVDVSAIRMKEHTTDNYGLEFQTYSSASLGTRMTILGSGNVGIGTTTPNQKLVVVGGINITGGINVSGDLSVNTEINLTALGNIFASGTIFASQLDVGGGFGSGGLTIQSDGDIVTEGDILFSGNITILNVTFLSVNGSITPNLDNTFDIGNESFRWRSIYAVGFNLTSNNLELLGDALIGGNVGIGTTSPDSLLQISQSAGTAGDMLHFRDTTDAADLVIRYDGTTAYQFRTETGGAGNLLLTLLDSGNVGIGTTGPLSTLHVNGSGANAGFRVSNASKTVFFVNASSGNVGIGTTSPGSKLHVAGNINASDLYLQQDTRSILFLRGDSADGHMAGLAIHPLDAGGIFIWYATDNDGNAKDTEFRIGADGNYATTKANITLRGSFKQTTTDINYFTGNVGIGTSSPLAEVTIASPSGGNLQFNLVNLGSVAGDSIIRWSNGTNVATPTEGAMVWGLGVDRSENKFEVVYNVDGVTTASANQLFTIDSSGNVGIGTTSPSQKLAVVGSGNFTGDLTVASLDTTAVTLTVGNDLLSINSILLQSGTNREANLGLQSGTGGPWQFIVESDFPTTGDGSFRIEDPNNDINFVIDTSGNVGIGDTNPDDLLTLNSSGITELRIAGTAGRLRFDETDTTDENFQFNHNGGGLLLTSNTNTFSTFRNIMKWESDGRVGINDTDPDATLEVVGNFMVSDLVGGDGDFFIVDSSGNVGIGTSSPTSKLHLLTTASDDDLGITIAVNNGGKTWNITNKGTFTGAQDAALVFSHNGVDRVTFLNGGNVGIGTTSPTSILEVEDGTTVLSITQTVHSTSAALAFRSDVSGRLEGDMWLINATITDGGGSSSDFESGDLVFSGRAGRSDNTLTERMRIKAGGNVGIGTASPSAKLEVAGNVSINGNLTLGPDSSKFFLCGNSTSGFFELRDADDNGWTRCSALDGVLTCQTGVGGCGLT